MKKWIVLSLAAAILTACGQKKETVEKSAPTVEQQTTTTTTSSSSEKKIEKTSPADYSRIDRSTTISSETLDALKPYVGYYSTSLTENFGSQSNLDITIDLAIHEDGTYTSYISWKGERGGNDNLRSQAYVNKNGELKSILNQSLLTDGYFDMRYGNLEFQDGLFFYQDYLDENGELLSIFDIHLDSEPFELSFKIVEGSIQSELDVPYAGVEPITITMHKTNELPKTLKYSPTQIHSYRDDHQKELDKLIETDDYIDSKNFFIQILTHIDLISGKHLGLEGYHKDYHLIPPTEASGYYTFDNKEITGIKYALEYKKDEQRKIIFAFSDLNPLTVYILKEVDGQKQAEEGPLFNSFSFIDLRSIMEDN